MANMCAKVTSTYMEFTLAFGPKPEFSFSFKLVVGMTSSVVIPDNRDSTDVLPDNTNLYSRLYALKKILLQQDADMLMNELDRLISRTKIDVYKMNILPANWKDLYDRILYL